ncbi:uncharacterized protein TNCV_698351 [Trichonephila clavipes]|nr:uncharacterized protein TNCV_698351 [Trichonephila clavipes]
MVSDGTEFAVGDIERLFDEARRNTKAKHENWAKYYDRRRHDVQIKKDHDDRHRGTANKRGPLISSPPGSWSEPNRKLKMGRKETLAYKRSLDSGSGGPERKIRKSIGRRVDKRTLSSNNNNDLPQFRWRVRTGETVIPNTSGYNLRPRRGAKVKSRPTNEKRTQQGEPVRARRSQEHQYSPYIEEQARSSSRNTRSRSSQQNCQVD